MWRRNLLGTLLIALSGRSTLTVLMAVKFMFCRSSEYSTILENTNKTCRKKLINDTDKLTLLKGIKSKTNAKKKATIPKVINTEEHFHLNPLVVSI